MTTENPQTLLMLTAGSFALGWLVARIGSWFGGGSRASQRDPRDDRIRSLEAELRVAQSSVEKIKSQLEARGKELSETQQLVKVREASCGELEDRIARLREDLKDSVIKTRELRAELTERAAEHVRSEVKLREVETELSVVQASSSLLATGVLDYDDPEEGKDEELPAFRAGA